jgi:hypothetical protein
MLNHVKSEKAVATMRKFVVIYAVILHNSM